MIEMRWYVEKWMRHTDYGLVPHWEKPVLQYRDVVVRNADGEVVIATEWQTVPEAIEEV